MLNNILMPIKFGTGHWSRLLFLLSFRRFGAVVVGLAEFGLVTVFRHNQIN